MNPTGNGGSAAPSEVVQFKVNGVQQGKVGFFGPPKSSKLMDIPSRRSHEYFPRVSNDTKYLIFYYQFDEFFYVKYLDESASVVARR